MKKKTKRSEKGTTPTAASRKPKRHTNFGVEIIVDDGAADFRHFRTRAEAEALYRRVAKAVRQEKRVQDMEGSSFQVICCAIYRLVSDDPSWSGIECAFSPTSRLKETRYPKWQRYTGPLPCYALPVTLNLKTLPRSSAS
jgi:hypothetical protein